MLWLRLISILVDSKLMISEKKSELVILKRIFMIMALIYYDY